VAALRRAAETNDQPRSAALTLCGHRRPPDVALVAFLGSLDRLRVPDLDSPIAPSPLHSTPSASGRSPFILAPPRDASPLPAGQERPEDHPNRRARAPAPLTPLQLFDRLDGCATLGGNSSANGDIDRFRPSITAGRLRIRPSFGKHHAKRAPITSTTSGGGRRRDLASAPPAASGWKSTFSICSRLVPPGVAHSIMSPAR